MIKLIKSYQSQRGVVALLTTIIISLLLLVIVTSMISLMIIETRQSNDSDQSTKAYFAAESGVEQQLSKIHGYINDCNNSPSHTNPDTGQDCRYNLLRAGDEDCAANTVSPGNQANSIITCSQLRQETNYLTDILKPNESREIEIVAPGSGVAGFRIEWNLDNPPGPLDAHTYGAPAFNAGSTGWPYPAAMEIIATGYNNGTTNLTAANLLPITTNILVPNSGLPGGTTVALGDAGPSAAYCVTPDPADLADPYACHATIAGLTDTNNYVIRLKALFNGAHFRITPVNALGLAVGLADPGAGLVSIPDNFITVDVTARSGDVFRRVIQKVPVKAGVTSGLEYVIYGDVDVCKNFGVNGSGASTDAHGLCPFP